MMLASFQARRVKKAANTHKNVTVLPKTNCASYNLKGTGHLSLIPAETAETRVKTFWVLQTFLLSVAING